MTLGGRGAEVEGVALGTIRLRASLCESQEFSAAAAAVPLFLTAMAGAASADEISNDLDASIDAAAENMPLNVGGATGSTTLYVAPRNSDGKNGCNLTGSPTLGLSIASSNSAVATVSPALGHFFQLQ